MGGPDIRVVAGWVRRLAVPIIRLLLVAAVVWLVRNHHRALLERGRGISLAEVRAFLPSVARLEDGGPGGSLAVRDEAGAVAGFAAASQPRCRGVVGYAGATDVLVVVDRDLRVLGVRVRASEDTRRYVDEVARDVRFNASWIGMLAASASRLRLGTDLDAVAGATPTSRAVAQGVGRVLADLAALPAPVARLTWRWTDLALGAAVTCGAVLTFAPPRRRRWWRRALQVAMLGYVGAIAADFVTLKLLVGWARSSVPWEFAPGLVALGAFALLAPAATGRPAYCLHVCPHGAAQEWIQRITPWRWEPRPALARLFGVVPLVLAAAALVAVVAGRPIDLAELEPFSAYDAGRQAVGIATVVIAAGGLLASAIVPKAYCRFGCPTGAVLEYVRVSPAKVRLGWRDALLASVAILVFLFTALSPT